MKNMRAKFGVAALALVCVFGCNKSEEGGANGTASNQSATGANNASEANNAQASTNNPGDAGSAINAPDPKVASTDPKKPNPNKDKVDIVKSEFDNTLVRADSKVQKIAPAKQDKGLQGLAEAKKLATSVDASMKKLTNSKLHFELGAILPEGHGDANFDTIIADQKRYLIRYATFSHERFPHFETYLVARQKDGTYSTLVGDKYQPGRLAPQGDILKGWVTDSIHYITNGIGTDKKPLTELITAAEKAKWKVNVETKTYEIGVFKRIVMESPTKPNRRYEIMIEPKKQLLVSFNADVDEAKRSQVSMNMVTMKSDRPLTDADLKPTIKVDKVNTLTPEEARAKGIKVPETKKEKPNT